MTDDNHVIDLLPAYALGALAETETRMVMEHLRDCTDCRAELESYQPVLAQLPLALDEQTPSPQLKRRLLAQLPVQPAEYPAQPTSWLARFQLAFRRPLPAWGAFALAAIFLLLISNAFLWLRLNQVGANSEFRTVAMAGTGNAPQATGLVVIGHGGSLGTLVVDGLPVLDPTHQYQLWLIRDGQRTSGGVFSTDAWGYGALAISAPDPLNSYQAVGITVEPAGGSPAPTGQKVMGGDL